jgi:hypothetical protein
MDDTELAVIDYLPGSWSTDKVVCIARRTRIPADRIPTERARKRRTSKIIFGWRLSTNPYSRIRV